VINKKLKTLGIVTALSLPMSAMATNGYLLHGYGKNKGMGGAGMAHAQDALSGANNPASSAWTETRFDLTAEFFFPTRGYKLSNPEGISFADGFDAIGAIPHNEDGTTSSISVKSEKDVFLIPAMGFNWQYSDKLTLAAAMYGAGLGTEFNRDDTQTIFANNNTFSQLTGGATANGTFFAGSTGIDLVLIMTNFHAAYKVTDDFSVGAGINLAMQSFKAKGLALFNKIAISTQTDGGREIDGIAEKKRSLAYGAGWNIGVQKEIIPGLTMGAAYYSRIGLRHKEYAGLFADNGDFSLPPRINIGMSVKLNDHHRVNFDIQKIEWSSISSTGNKFIQLVNTGFKASNAIDFDENFPLQALGNKDSAGFGFEDSLIYKFGYEFSLENMPSWTWRLGYSYQSQIIPSNATLFPMLAPATIQRHYTFGFTKDFNNGYEFNFNTMYTGKEWLKGTGESKGIDIYLEELTMEFALGIKW